LEVGTRIKLLRNYFYETALGLGIGNSLDPKERAAPRLEFSFKSIDSGIEGKEIILEPWKVGI
jgi:hypothetical protein